MPLTATLIIISFSSPVHSFIPDLKASFLQILPTAAFFFFFRTDYMIPPCYASAVLAMALCPSVCLSVTSRSSTKTAKRIGSPKQHHTIAQCL